MSASAGASKFGAATNVSTPVASTIANCDASAPPRIAYVTLSPASPSDAWAVPTAVWFSAASNVAGDVNDGAALGAVTVAVSVPVLVPNAVRMWPRPVTVRVKVSSLAPAGIVTTGMALVLSSNVTVTPLAGLVSAQL